MSTNKAALKAAKTALDAEDYETVVTQAQIVLASDAGNYPARLFLGRAFEKQGQLDNAADTYRKAADSKPDEAQAWLGLCSLFEGQGSKKVDDYIDVAVRVGSIHAAAEDAHRCQTIIDKMVGFVKQNGTSAQQKRALRVTLPGSPVYDFLEGRLPHPTLGFTRIAEITEREEAERIKTEINNRRTRIGARVGQVTTEVKREVFSESELEELYQSIINWTVEDEIRREYEEKLLLRAYEHLLVLPTDQKPQKLDQVLSIAEGMVIIHHAFQLAWDLVLETRDFDNLQDLDANILREYVTLFAESGLGRILKAWLSSELCPFPPPKKSEEEQSKDDEAPEVLSAEDRLAMMTEGVNKSENSPFAYRLACDYFLYLDEHQTVVETSRAGLQVLSTQSAKLSMSLQNTKDALNSVLGTALVHYQAPRNHAEAKRLFEDILQRKPKLTPALIGLGLIFEEIENYGAAINFLQQALGEDPGNVRVGTELAWCKALNGDNATARDELENYLPKLKTDDPRSRDLRALCIYRIGICMWNLDDSKAARKDRNGAYARFLSAIKTNVNFAPAYTSLGHYYELYAKDNKRARQCFQKAFELSPAETEAAERLARSFADKGEWEIVEVISQRVIDSGRARPPPGSKRKGLSWPYSALGVVQMNKQEYQQAIVSFLAALRISPDDYQSYVGLGESYHNSGRYNSASRTFNYALEPHEDGKMKITGETWFAKYMLSNVHRELGEYQEATDGLQGVLEDRPDEFGVLISLLQTYVEHAWHCVEKGLFGQAIDNCNHAIDIATKVARNNPQAFNLWKSVGDACITFSWVLSGIDKFPSNEIRSLLDGEGQDEALSQLSDIDGIRSSALAETQENGNTTGSSLPLPLVAGILSYKRAIFSSAHDIHAQAVAWYNLGWAEHRAFSLSDGKSGKKYLKAAVRCFKRAIEMEAGNSEFWNALGVVTTTLNPQVAQHAFVRSLHLNELNAKVWTNLGVLYTLQNDHELAHKSFGRAQSTDPDYAHAWVGEGLIALMQGESKEALNHFTHAFEISDSASVISKRQYALSTFDHLLASPTVSNNLTALIQPLFALEQLRAQAPKELPYKHLSALFLERVGNFNDAIETLTELCSSAEAEYESSESDAALARFAHAKADVARCQLAAHSHSSASENANTALDLSADAESSGLDPEARRKLRLSAHLTAGLAAHYLKQDSDAINMFRAALEESDNNPDVVCLLVQVLWAHGGSEEKTAAREQLFECFESNPEHAGVMTLLGAIAALDNDEETTSAVRDDLVALRTNANLQPAEQSSIDSLLSALASLNDNDNNDAALASAQTATLLNPERSHAWKLLAELSGDSYAADMALQTAQKAVPPNGTSSAGELAAAFAGVGTVADAQRAMALAPWERIGWEVMAEALDG
jgi:superkiller protein 3